MGDGDITRVGDGLFYRSVGRRFVGLECGGIVLAMTRK